LHVVAYEGGWALGGDSNTLPLQDYAIFVDPRAAQVNATCIDAFTQGGGSLVLFGTYEQWLYTDLEHSQSYPLVQSIITRDQSLPAVATDGISVPATLTQANITWELNDFLWRLIPGSWESWNILVPATGSYQIVCTAGSGGTAGVYVDGTTMVASGASDS